MSTNKKTPAIVIAEAGFSEPRRGDLLKQVESIFEAHGEESSATDSLGSLADLRSEMAKVAQIAKKLMELINDLPRGACTYLNLGLPSTHDPNPIAVLNPLSVLIERAQRYHESVQRGSGRPKNNLHVTLLQLVSLWEDEFPNVTGIRKDGSGPDEGREPYKGPLFDFVISLLDAEEIPYRSRHAVGFQLWELWSERRRKDELHAAGRCTRCEKELQDKARYLCDDCFRSWPWPQTTVQKPT